MLKILLPTDFSDNAQTAIDYAVFLFEKEDCTFYLLHAYHIAPSAPDNKSDWEQKLVLLQERLEAAKNPKHKFEPIMVTDTALSAINATVIDQGIQYVFMGTKGSSAVREIFMGSVTLSAIKHVENCPIIAVPGDYDYDIPDEILFASDFKHAFTSLELAPLIEMASLWDSGINVVHINAEKVLDDTQKLNKELLRNNLKGIRHLFFQVKKQDSISSTLYHMEKENKIIGMVALLKTKHGFFEKLTREPVIRNLTFKTEVPLLIFPAIE